MDCRQTVDIAERSLRTIVDLNFAGRKVIGKQELKDFICAIQTIDFNFYEDYSTLDFIKIMQQFGYEIDLLNRRNYTGTPDGVRNTENRFNGKRVKTKKEIWLTDCDLLELCKRNSLSTIARVYGMHLHTVIRILEDRNLKKKIKRITKKEDESMKNMKRTQIYLTESQHAKFKEMASEKQISLGELLRRLIDEYLDTRSELKA